MTTHGAPGGRQDPPDTHRSLPVSEAARILSLSPTTIRRKIDAGELEAERVIRPQGTAFLVTVPADNSYAPTTPLRRTRRHQEAPETRQWVLRRW